MDDNKIIPYSILGKTGRQKLVDIIPLKKPFTIFIEPTNVCNFKCVQCPHGLDNYGELSGPLKHMDNICFQKIISDLDEWRKNDEDEHFLKVIRLYLEGEPFCNSNLCEMLRILKEKKFAGRIEIVTNGSLLTEDICEMLVKYELDYIKISVYSVIEEKNKKITNTSVKPKEIRENIKRLRQIRDLNKFKKPYIYVKIIDTYSDENDVFKSYYNGIADEVCIEKPMNWNSSDQDFIEKLYEVNADDVKNDIRNGKMYRKICPFPFHTLSIKSNGDVLVCCVDWLRSTKVGNILNNTLQEIWGSKEMYNFRKMHIEGKRNNNISCANCELPMTLANEDNIDGFSIEKL